MSVMSGPSVYCRCAYRQHAHWRPEALLVWCLLRVHVLLASCAMGAECAIRQRLLLGSCAAWMHEHLTASHDGRCCRRCGPCKRTVSSGKASNIFERHRPNTPLGSRVLLQQVCHYRVVSALHLQSPPGSSLDQHGRSASGPCRTWELSAQLMSSGTCKRISVVKYMLKIPSQQSKACGALRTWQGTS